MKGVRLPHHSKLVSVSKHDTLAKLSPSFAVHDVSSAVGGSPSSLTGCTGGGAGSFLTRTLYREPALSCSTITHGQLTAPILMLAYSTLPPLRSVSFMSRSGGSEG